MLTQDKLVQLLNRPLTTNEVKNLELYLEIAKKRLEDMLCFSLECDPDEVQIYDVRAGYRTVFTMPFTEVTSVTVNNEVVDPSEYTVRQFDSRTGSWFNSIVFKRHLDRDVTEIEVSAVWGFDCMPQDLQLVLARLFALNTTEQTSDNRVKSKKIEDFTVTYGDVDTYGSLADTYMSTVYKYSLCSIGSVRNESVYSIY